MQQTWILALGLVLAGCGGKKADNKTDDTTKSADKPADKPADPPADKPADKPASGTPLSSDADYESTRAKLAEQLTNAFKSNGTDCDKIAADVSKMDYDAIAGLKAYEKAHPDIKAKHKADDEKLAEDFIIPAVKVCGKNQAFMDVFKKMNR